MKESFVLWWRSDNRDGDVVFILLMILALVIMIAVIVYEHREFEIFAAEHGCVIVAERKCNIMLITGVRGTSIGSSPDQVAYKCDDGVTYWRNK